MLVRASQRRSDCYGVPSESGGGEARLLGNPHPHRHWARERDIPLAEVPIGADRHVGMLLRCGVGKDFLLHGVLHGFEYHDCFCCKM